ncbi:MAG TPA: hypothetical protein VFS11_05230 [Gemmatimonadales bacterium]|nr:hypothetical protein [Gemmatimonadales bacterium]
MMPPRFSPILAAALLLAACSGGTGPAGPTGPGGPAGRDGNANVVTDTLTLTSAEWLWQGQYTLTIPGSTVSWLTRYADIARPDLTADVLARGLVLAYMQADATVADKWVPLPLQFLSGTLDYYHNYVYEALEGKVRLHFFYTPNASNASTPPDLITVTLPTRKFKVTIIDGTIAAAIRAEGVNLADPIAVAAALTRLGITVQGG